MEYLQNLLDSSSIPVVTAFLLGLLTAISPCPLATNIAAIGYLSKDIANKRQVFRNGLLYTLGRIVAYSLFGIILIAVLRQGTSLFAIEKALGKWGELLRYWCWLGFSCFSVLGLTCRNSDFQETVNESPDTVDGEYSFWGCCSHWPFVLPAAYSISGC